MPRTFTLTGRVVEANTLFTACTSWKIALSAAVNCVVVETSVMGKYLPLPLEAIDWSCAVCEGPWPPLPGNTSRVYV